MKILGFRFHLRLSDLYANYADRSREEFDLSPAMMEWHTRDLRSLNGLR
jgi:hypothetical protein